MNDITFDIGKIIENDGIFISVVGYVVVFFSLIILSIIIHNLSKALTIQRKKKYEKEGHSPEEASNGISGEETAAIAMALHLHFNEIHDFENTVLTIKKVEKRYSPWSSKLYGLRQYPVRKNW